MPSYIRKRTYATAFKRKSYGTRYKKRRTQYRRRQRGGNRTLDYTQQNTTGHAVGFRGRKTSRRAYKKHIWNSTIFKDHYRSIQTLQFTETTPATFGTTGTIVQFNKYKNTTGEFWTAAGGAQDIDAGTTIPVFEGGVILRGGQWNLTIANQSGDDVKVKLWFGS